MTIETIIWDWNGTLLNDSHLSLSTINRLLKERNLKTLSHEQYLEVFTFPVIIIGQLVSILKRNLLNFLPISILIFIIMQLTIVVCIPELLNRWLASLRWESGSLFYRQWNSNNSIALLC